MTPEAFVAKWHANRQGERASAQSHFNDLCALLDEPSPSTDPDGSNYAFEKGVDKTLGGRGWADVWRRGCFAWEYKKRHRDLDEAHRQLLNYAGALGNPPLLVVSDIARIVVRTNWTNRITVRREIGLADLHDPEVRFFLKNVLSDPEQLRPQTSRQELTIRVATDFANLAKRLRDARGHSPEAVALFINRLVFCLFADDVRLLPDGLFRKLVRQARARPSRFAAMAGALFGAMAHPEGEIGIEPVPWFNGGLFDDATALPLEREDIDVLQEAAEVDWGQIDPSIFGTLFEQGVDPGKASRVGVHYTGADKIELIVDPVIRRPWLAAWEAEKATLREMLGAAPDDAARADLLAVSSGHAAATERLRAFLARLRAFRVLDPACGSGNFLYLSLVALKDFELRVTIEAEALGLPREPALIGPESVLGIEINPYAAELARVSVWIGHIQWARRHGLPPPESPVLRPLHTVECRDAILADDGTSAGWPPADAIVGNPPFLGGKRLRSVLGDAHCEALFAAYAGRVPAEADLVCYWFEQARMHVSPSPRPSPASAGEGEAPAPSPALAGEGRGEGAFVPTGIRVGLVATNSIRGGANRRVLDAIAREATIFEAWSDEEWTVEGAAVRVSLVAFGPLAADGPLRLDGAAVPAIRTDLTADAADLTTARRLAENAGVAFMGDTKGGAFDVPGELARKWLLEPTNPNGRPNADVLRPWANGMDVTRRSLGHVDHRFRMDDERGGGGLLSGAVRVRGDGRQAKPYQQ